MVHNNCYGDYSIIVELEYIHMYIVAQSLNKSTSRLNKV